MRISPARPAGAAPWARHYACPPIPNMWWDKTGAAPTVLAIAHRCPSPGRTGLPRQAGAGTFSGRPYRALAIGRTAVSAASALGRRKWRRDRKILAKAPEILQRWHLDRSYLRIAIIPLARMGSCDGVLNQPGDERGLGGKQLGQVAEAKQFFHPRGQVDQFQLAVALFDS
jgi:hypothetical protein